MLARRAASSIAVFVLMFLSAASLPSPARATTTIVAFGASNIVGRDGTSFPAELDAMLKAKGYDVQVVNAGVNGDTSAGMLSRVDSAVPSGTRLVLLGVPRPNDAKAGLLGEEASNMAQIIGRLRARGIQVIELPKFTSLGARHSAADPEHFDASGYRSIAAGILPRVVAAIGPPHK
jgi:acyl-CoA thioesterase I